MKYKNIEYTSINLTKPVSVFSVQCPHLGGGDPGLAAPDGPRQDGARLVVAGEDLGHAAVAHPAHRAC